MGRRKMKFLERYPDCPTAEDIEVLDLVMCKKYALEILEGKKKVDLGRVQNTIAADFTTRK